MQLSKQSIPKEFLENLPEGLKAINRKGNTYVVVEDLRCPNGHSLISNKVKIHNESAIHIKIEGGNSKGNMFLDPFWGLHNKLFDFMFEAQGKIAIKASCPDCSISLMEENNCKSCDCDSKEQVVFLLPDNKNKITACGTWNCPEHQMSVTNIPAEVVDQLQSINYQDLHFNSEAIGF